MDLIAKIFADGPSFVPYNPDKSKIRAWGTWVEGIITAFTSNGGLIYDTRAQLYADTSFTERRSAWVTEDPEVAFNGVYGFDPMTLTWSYKSKLPFDFIAAIDAGAGTANAIALTSDFSVSDGMVVMFSLHRDTTANTVTISINGGTPLTAKTNRGNDASALTAGMEIWGRVRTSDNTFRLLNDQDVAALVGQAEAAKEDAEAAAASIDIRNIATRSALKALNTATTTLVYLGEGQRAGLFRWTAGDYTAAIASDPLEGLYIKADAVAASAGAWVRQGDWQSGGVRPEWYGAVADGAADDTAALRAALASSHPMRLSKADYRFTAALPLFATGQIIIGEGRGYGYGRPDYFGRDYKPVSRLIASGTFAKRILTRRKYRASAVDPKDDPMSAAIEVHADGVGFVGWCLWLECDYSDLSPTNLGANVDIGVFRGGRPGFFTRDFAIIGHFRKTKLLHDYTRALNLPELTDPDGNPLPKGASGQTFAGGDGWTHENILMWGWGSGFTEYGPIHPGGNYYDEATGALPDQRGASGDSDGRFTGRCAIYVTHPSGRRLVSPTGYGSALTRANMEAEPDFSPAGIDIDGWAGNSGSTTTGRGQVRNMIFGTMRVSSGAAFRVRLRDCDQINFQGISWIESGDWPSTASSWKDASGADININDYVNVTYGHVATDQTKTGVVTLEDAVGGIGQTWVANKNRLVVSQSSGSHQVTGLIIATSPFSSAIGDAGRVANLADDEAVSFPIPGANQACLVSIMTANGADATAPRGLLVVRSGAAPSPISMASTANITFTTGALANGAGTDGNVTISTHTDGRFYVSNRSGGPRTIAVQFLAPT